MKETKRQLYVERDGFFTEASMLFMALAVVFRVIGSIGRWEDMNYLVTQVALPVFSGLVFLICLLAFSKRAFWTTVIPVVFGVVFFIFRIMPVESELQKVCCIALYVVIAVFYAMAFSMKGLKWILAAVLGAAFVVHVVWLDLPVLMDLENPVLFVDGMQELSVLGIILSLLSVSLAMKMPEKAAPEQAAPEQPAPESPVTEQPAPSEPAEEPELVVAPAEEPADAEPVLPVILAEPAQAYPVEEIPVPAAEPEGEQL